MTVQAWIAGCLLAAFSAAAFGDEGRAVVYRKEVMSGVALTVERVPVDPALQEAINPQVRQETGRLETISLCLQKQDQRAVLASSLLGEYADSRRSFSVLGIEQAKDEIVVICTVYDLVGLWRVPRGDGLELERTGWALLIPSRFAARTPLKPGDVEVAASQTDNGLWTVRITDKRLYGSPVTRYTQQQGTWRFLASEPEKKGAAGGKD